MPSSASSPPARPASRSALRVRAADQHERGALRIAKLRDRGLILLALRLEPRPGPEAACALPAGLDVVSPGAGQVHQPQRVTGRGGIEDDMVIAAGQLRMDDQLRELIKGGHLDRALASQLLLDLADLPLGDHATVGADHALAIGDRRGVGVQVHHRHARRSGHRRDRRADRDAEHVSQVRRRIGAHDQHTPARITQRHRRRAGDRRLPDPALAREEQKRRVPRDPVQTVQRTRRHQTDRPPRLSVISSGNVTLRSAACGGCSAPARCVPSSAV